MIITLFILFDMTPWQAVRPADQHGTCAPVFVFPLRNIWWTHVHHFDFEGLTKALPIDVPGIILVEEFFLAVCFRGFSLISEML